MLRRSPAQSRPPSVYSLVRHGDYYDVWQRPSAPSTTIAEHLPLGDFADPAAKPACADVQNLARLAGPDGTIAAVERPPTAVASLAQSTHPATGSRPKPAAQTWSRTAPARPGCKSMSPRPVATASTCRAAFATASPSVVDGAEIGSVEQQLNEARQFLYFGQVPLRAGSHEVELVLDAQTLAPGSGGPPEPIGPLVLSPAGAEDLAGPARVRLRSALRLPLRLG